MTGRRMWIYGCAALAAAVLVLVVTLRVGGGGPQPQISGLPSPGPVTDWGLPLCRLALDLCGVVVVGFLVTGIVVSPPSEQSRAAVRAAGRWALGWALTAGVLFLLTLSNLAAVPATDVLSDWSLLRYGLSQAEGRAPLIVLVAAVVTAIGTRTRPSAAGRAALVVVAIFGLLPMVYVGHAASADHHDIALSGLALHVVAVAVWVGGLAGLLLYLRDSTELSVALPRFSAIALWCFIAVAISGTANAWVRMGAVSDLWNTSYGQFVLAKTLALGALGLFGWNHRRHTVAQVGHAPARRTFARLAAGEIAVMAAAIGLAVGLSRTPPPPGAGHHQHLLLDYDLEPFTLGGLFTEIRVDPLIVLALLGLAVGYLAGVRRAERWPGSYVTSWFGGLALLALVLIGGFGGYSRALFAAHVVQLAVLGVVAPLLLVAAAPLTLAVRSCGPSVDTLLYGDAARRLTHPVLVLTLYAVPYPLLYITGWFSLALANHPVHLVTQAFFVVTAMLFFWVVIGVDPLPRPVPWRTRALMLAAAAAVHLLMGALLLAGPIQAEDWFFLTAPPLATDLIASQRIGAITAGAVALAAMACLAVTLGTQRHAAASRMAALR